MNNYCDANESDTYGHIYQIFSCIWIAKHAIGSHGNTLYHSFIEFCFLNCLWTHSIATTTALFQISHTHTYTHTTIHTHPYIFIHVSIHVNKQTYDEWRVLLYYSRSLFVADCFTTNNHTTHMHLGGKRKYVITIENWFNTFWLIKMENWTIMHQSV